MSDFCYIWWESRSFWSQWKRWYAFTITREVNLFLSLMSMSSYLFKVSYEDHERAYFNSADWALGKVLLWFCWLGFGEGTVLIFSGLVVYPGSVQAVWFGELESLLQLGIRQRANVYSVSSVVLSLNWDMALDYNFTWINYFCILCLCLFITITQMLMLVDFNEP